MKELELKAKNYLIDAYGDADNKTAFYAYINGYRAARTDLLEILKQTPREKFNKDLFIKLVREDKEPKDVG